MWSGPLVTGVFLGCRWRKSPSLLIWQKENKEFLGVCQSPPYPVSLTHTVSLSYLGLMEDLACSL